MPNIAAALKSEIARVARKEVRLETTGLKKAAAGYSHEIATLKKGVQGTGRQLKRLGRTGPSNKAVTAEADDSKQVRFRTRFVSQRKKLGLPAASMAKLLGVSAFSVYEWESGQARPRRVSRRFAASVSARRRHG